MLSFTNIAVHTANIFHQSGTIVAVDEPSLEDHNSPKSTAFTVADSCCYNPQFWQRYNGMFPPLQCHAQQFHTPTNPLFLPIHPSLTLTLTLILNLILNHWKPPQLSTVSIVLPFKKATELESNRIYSVQTGFFHSLT